MKKAIFSLGALIALAAVSCTMEESFQDKQLKEQELTITATREGDETLTRTYRDDSDMSIWWIPGDAISLFYGSGNNGGSKFTSVNTTDTTKVTNFTGVITAITGGGEIAVDQTYFWGLYPYQEDASCDGTSVTMTLPKEQTAVPGTFATNTFPSLGRSQGLTMGFYNICSGMKFSVTKKGIKKVTLKSRNGELLTGKAKVSFEGGIPVAEIIDGSDEVILEAPAGEYFEPGKYYFLVMFPTEFTNGFTVTLETFTKEASVKKTGSITAKRSNFGRIANIDANATYSRKTGNIPIEDANFKAYLVSNFDGNGDGEISYEEAEAITSIDVCTDEIESVRGIEFMENLQSLKCAGNYTSLGQLTSLDISNNTSLIYLDCSDNQLNDLDLSKNVELKTLYCSSNWFSTVNVSNNTALELFWCQGHQLTSLDVSNNTALVTLQCSDNQITELDLSNNTALSWIHCASNQLTTLELPKTNSLSSLWCDNNQLTSLDVSSCTGLTDILCDRNQLTSFDVSKNTALTSLSCSGNQLTALDVSKNTALTYLYCGGNQLTALDVSKNTALTELSCSSNQLTALDVSKNTMLTRLYCGGNQLTALDVSKNTALTYLSCGSNQLTALDVSKNTVLSFLNCNYNQITDIDISNNIELNDFRCESNQLTSLDVTHNPEIWRILFRNNNISSIDLSNNPKLEYIGCSGLTTLDVSKCAENIFRIYRDSVLEVIKIREGQTLPNDIPENMIVVIPDNGGGEGTGEDDWGDGN